MESQFVRPPVIMDSPKLLLVLMVVTVSMAAPQINERQVVGTVISQLQPAIAEAVAQALAGSRRTGSRFGGATGAASLATGDTQEENYGPAQYDFTYKVSDDERQTYIARQENRNGDDVTGSYNFIDPTGALVTVNYEAGPMGYSETRDVEKGAVQMREIPGAWTGPLAGVDDVQTTGAAVAARKPSSGSLSQADIIAQIIAALEPKIDSAVASAVGASQSSSSISSSSSGLGRSSFSNTRSSSSGQDNIINSVISSLQPRINSAVNSVISSSRSVQAVPRSRVAPVGVRGRPQATVGGNLQGVFGAEGSSVRVETPEFAFEF